MLVYSLVLLFYVWHGCNKDKTIKTTGIKYQIYFNITSSKYTSHWGGHCWNRQLSYHRILKENWLNTVDNSGYILLNLDLGFVFSIITKIHGLQRMNPNWLPDFGFSSGRSQNQHKDSLYHVLISAEWVWWLIWRSVAAGVEPRDQLEEGDSLIWKLSDIGPGSLFPKLNYLCPKTCHWDPIQI